MPLDHAVEYAVVRHDQVRVPTDEQPVAMDALRAQGVDLAEQNLRIDHDTVADHRHGRTQDAARDQAQLQDRLAGDDGVPGVRPALAAHDHAGVGGENVDCSSFALIAPLGADENRQWHRSITNRGGAG